MSFGIGGADLGTFWAQFKLDLSDLDKAERRFDTFGKSVQGAFKRAGGQNALSPLTEGIKSAETEAKSFFQSMDAGFNRMGGILGAVTAAAIPMAMRVRNLDMAFQALTQTEAEANKYLGEMRQLAEEVHAPFLSIAEAGVSLIPILRNTNADLATTVELSQRLRLLDPTARTYDVAVAIREFLSGNVLSLSRRFELPLSQLSAIMSESGGDVNQSLELLSDYLDSIGITKDALIELGEAGRYAFDVLSSDVTEFMGNAGRPFIDEFLAPIASMGHNVANIIRNIGENMTPGQQTGLDVGSILAGTLGVGFAASRGAGLVSSLTGGAVGAGVASAAIPVAVTVFGLEAGAVLGAALVQGLADAGFEPAQAYQGMDIGQILGVTATSAVSGIAGGMSEVAARLRGEADPGAFQAEAQQRAAANMVYILGGASALERFNGAMEETTKVIQHATEIVAPGIFGQDVLDAFGEFQKDLVGIDRQFEEDRAKLFLDAGKSIMKSQADFNLDTTRREEDFNADQADREDKQQAKLADIKEKADKDTIRREQEYNARMESLNARHRQTLLEAAGNLNAEAVLNEQQRYALQVSEMERSRGMEEAQRAEDTQAKIDEQASSFQEEQDQRQRQHEVDMERRRQDHQADIDAIWADTYDRLNALQAQRDAEKTTREAAFIDQYNSLVGHSQRIATEWDAMLANLDAQLSAFVQAHGVAVKGDYVADPRTTGVWTTDRKVATATSNAVDFSQSSTISKSAYSAAISGAGITGPFSSKNPSASSMISGAISGLGTPPKGLSGNMYIPAWGFASGGDLPGTGTFFGHAGEFVLRKSTADALRSAMGGMIDQNLLENIAVNGGSRSVGSVVINVFPSPGMNERDLAQEVRNELASIWEGDQ